MHEKLVSFSISFCSHISSNIYRYKDNTGGTLNGSLRKSEDGTESEKNGDSVKSLKDEQPGEFQIGLNDTPGSNIEQDQEESSMWQKCPVITFQTFDDLTGWLIYKVIGMNTSYSYVI